MKYDDTSKNRRERSKCNLCIFHQILKLPPLFEILRWFFKEPTLKIEIQIVYFSLKFKITTTFWDFMTVLQRTAVKDRNTNCVFFIKFQNCYRLWDFMAVFQRTDVKDRNTTCAFFIKFQNCHRLLSFHGGPLKNCRERSKCKLVYSSSSLKISPAFWSVSVTTQTIVKWVMWKPISVVVTLGVTNDIFYVY